MARGALGVSNDREMTRSARTDSIAIPENAEPTSLKRQHSQEAVSVFQIDPLQDSRWSDFLEEDPRASVFHTPSWLRALHRTYGYDATVLTTAGTGEKLINGIVFCRVLSWLTGPRLVSVPFSDHCEPLVEDADQLSRLTNFASNNMRGRNWRYVEIRPLGVIPGCPEFPKNFEESRRYWHHELDLRPPLEKLHGNFHKDCVQRKIRRAEREGLTIEEGQSEESLKKFYELLILTRLRHQLPPQPLRWFRNLIECFGDSLKISIASNRGRAVAAILTLQYKNRLVYKYGCSDVNANKLGGMQLLFWHAIQDAKRRGLETLDLGRTDWTHFGLLNFKERWGATRSPLFYARCPKTAAVSSSPKWTGRAAGRMFELMPSALLSAAGRILYRHFG
jgi:CelD/BcsL family acetyltransferase involved in cellulose biosynthesis